ncbi:uncharacterized protein LOC126845817 isoform X2 [Adelges cooleyi]|uniref:uncharacterized protein LOC126845817 isoform X2 n=1 Tax=Adelges cooleyi TaxID=133065 RepID=UPI00217FAC09|nr:uncharacterized protein LOC126845817 isoform X2 [Adelges cooleyi]
MHFKTAVILFALYFVTATQSVGLNMRQIEIIDYLFTIHCVGNIFKGENVEIELRNCMKNFSHSENEEEHENCIDDSSMEDIVKMGLEISMNSILDFEYKEGRTDAQQVQDLLVFLANTEKKFDDFTSQSFSSYEITVFVGLFNKCDQSGKHDGLLDYKEVIQVIDALNLEKCVKENLEGAFEEDETFNAAEFLYEFLKVKPEGRGLEMYQVQEMIDLHKNHKIKGDHIDPVEIKNMFTKLSIVNDDYEGLLVFHPNPTRKGPLELQELLIVLAEYNKVADINYNPIESKKCDLYS